jgi:hypothetical protein
MLYKPKTMPLHVNSWIQLAWKTKAHHSPTVPVAGFLQATPEAVVTLLNPAELWTSHAILLQIAKPFATLGQARHVQFCRTITPVMLLSMQVSPGVVLQRQRMSLAMRVFAAGSSAAAHRASSRSWHMFGIASFMLI